MFFLIFENLLNNAIGVYVVVCPVIVSFIVIIQIYIK